LFLYAVSTADAQSLFVGENSGSIKRYNATTGAFEGNFVPSSATPRGIAFGPDGNLYVAENAAGVVRKYNGQTGGLLASISTGNSPTGLAFSADGSLYVSSYTNSNIRKVNLISNTSTLFANLFEANGIAVAPDGEVYATSFGGRSLNRFNSAGSLLGNTTITGLGYGLTLGTDNNVYVSNTSSVLKFNRTTLSSSIFISTGSGGLSSPFDVDFGYDGNLYVSSGGNGSVKRYNGSTGAFINNFVNPNSGGLTTPVFMAFGPAPVPAPSALAVFLIGGVPGIILLRRRRKQSL